METKWLISWFQSFSKPYLKSILFKETRNGYWSLIPLLKVWITIITPLLYEDAVLMHLNICIILGFDSSIENFIRNLHFEIDCRFWLYLYAAKFSRHLIIRIEKTAFKDNSHAGAFVTEVWLGEDCRNFFLLPNLMEFEITVGCFFFVSWIKFPHMNSKHKLYLRSKFSIIYSLFLLWWTESASFTTIFPFFLFRVEISTIVSMWWHIIRYAHGFQVQRRGMEDLENCLLAKIQSLQTPLVNYLWTLLYIPEIVAFV